MNLKEFAEMVEQCRDCKEGRFQAGEIDTLNPEKNDAQAFCERHFKDFERGFDEE